MPGRSRSKNGVAALAYVPGIHERHGRAIVDGRDEPDHDELEHEAAQAPVAARVKTVLPLARRVLP